jgi:hypothetical protein
MVKVGFYLQIYFPNKFFILGLGLGLVICSYNVLFQ